MTKKYPNSIIRFMYGNTYQNLAKQLNVSRQTIYNYIHGLRKPTPEHKEALMQILMGYHGSYLYEDEVFGTPCEFQAETTESRKFKIGTFIKDILAKAEVYIDKGIDEEFWTRIVEELSFVKKN